MYVRCPGCKASSRLAVGPKDSKARCKLCGRFWSLASIGDLGETPDRRFERALAFSVEKGIDLASSYSVLLGLMPLARACRVRKPGAQNADKINLEGDRVTRASALAQEHDLPMHLAFDVAAGDLSVRDAKTKLKAERLRPTSEVRAVLPAPAAAAAPGASRAARFAPVAAGLAMGVTALFLVGREPASPTTPRAPEARRPEAQAAAPAAGAALVVAASRESGSAPTANVTLDEQGRLTRIAGRSPTAVLEAYCSHVAGLDACRVIGVRPTDPPRQGIKLGVLAKYADGTTDYAVWIRREPDGRGWYAGNGLRPLQVEPVPR